MKLQLNDAELASCVGCGLCLPHCPTYRVTGEEALSPRGRIASMRTVELEGAPIDDAFVGFMETCVQCRGCEPACPSGVPYGRLIEGTREALAQTHRSTPRWQRGIPRILRTLRFRWSIPGTRSCFSLGGGLEPLGTQGTLGLPESLFALAPAR